eukprot:jgi/Bigna1/130035/aug1.10_g4743
MNEVTILIKVRTKPGRILGIKLIKVFGSIAVFVVVLLFPLDKCGLGCPLDSADIFCTLGFWFPFIAAPLEFIRDFGEEYCIEDDFLEFDLKSEIRELEYKFKTLRDK